jgi:Helix-loop-helix DNA-binding domain
MVPLSHPPKSLLYFFLYSSPSQIDTLPTTRISRNNSKPKRTKTLDRMSSPNPTAVGSNSDNSNGSSPSREKEKGGAGGAPDLNTLMKSLSRAATKDGENSSSSSSSGGNNSDNSALVSLGNTSFGFNFDSEEGMSNNSSKEGSAVDDNSDGSGRRERKKSKKVHSVTSSSAAASHHHPKKKRKKIPKNSQSGSGTSSGTNGTGSEDTKSSSISLLLPPLPSAAAPTGGDDNSRLIGGETLSQQENQQNQSSSGDLQKDEAAANAVASLEAIVARSSYPTEEEQQQQAAAVRCNRTTESDGGLKKKNHDDDDDDNNNGGDYKDAASSGGYNTDDDEAGGGKVTSSAVSRAKKASKHEPTSSAGASVNTSGNNNNNNDDSDGDDDDDDDETATNNIDNNSSSSIGNNDPPPRRKQQKKNSNSGSNKRVERNQREKERSLRISRQISELRNLLSSGGIVVPKGTKSSVLTEAANYIRMLQQHQYRSEMYVVSCGVLLLLSGHRKFAFVVVGWELTLTACTRFVSLRSLSSQRPAPARAADADDRTGRARAPGGAGDPALCRAERSLEPREVWGRPAHVGHDLRRFRCTATGAPSSPGSSDRRTISAAPAAGVQQHLPARHGGYVGVPLHFQFVRNRHGHRIDGRGLLGLQPPLLSALELHQAGGVLHDHLQSDSPAGPAARL